MSNDSTTLESPAPASQSIRGGAGLLGNLRVVSLCVLVSRILGLARDSAMTSLLGIGPVHDTFVLAFRIPNMARQLFGEGALTTAFLPVFVRELEHNGVRSARQTYTAIALTTGTILVALVALAEICIGVLLLTAAEASSTRLLLQLLAILFPYTILICLAALSCAALHSLKQFLWAGVVPVLLNGIWLAGVFIVGNSGYPINGQARMLAFFVLGAGLLQLATPAFALHRLGMGLIADWKPARGRIREVYASVIPVVIGLSITQISTVVDTVLAWGLAPGENGQPAPFSVLGLPATLESGTATALYLGQRMYQFPLGVFGVALGTVLFPVLARHAERGEMDLLRLALTRGMRLVIAIAVPASAGLFVLALPITAVLFHHGAVNDDEAQFAARIIAAYGGAVWAFIALAILNRGFYAVGDRITPMRLGIVALAVNLGFNLTTVWFLGGLGLVAGMILATLVQLLMTLRSIQTKLGQLEWSSLRTCLLKTLTATACMTVACMTLLYVLPVEGSLTARAIALLANLSLGLAVYFAAALLLRIDEVTELLRSFSSGDADSE